MASLHDSVLDAALDYIDTNCSDLYICSQEPTTLEEANSTYALGTSSSPAVGSPDDGDTSGRKVTVAAISDGTVSADGTATHWALVSGTELLATGDLDSSQAVTSGNVFTLTEFDIELPDPAS
jgi:hypothetical protein